MNGSMSRRSLLAGVGCAAAWGSMGARLLSVAHAEEQGESAISLSLLYRNGPKAKFDSEAYAKGYLPLLKSVCGDSIERIELRTPHVFAMPGMPGAGGGGRQIGSGGTHSPEKAAQPMGPQSPLLAAVSVWIRDVKAFGEKTATAAQLTEELKKITEIEPLVQFDKALEVLGDARDSIPVQDNVFSTYFPTKEGAQFDPKYYGEKVIPLMIKLYGAKSIRRVEFSMGTEQGGAKPVVTAAAHFYIRDRAAWDAAGMQAYPQLMAEGPKYTTIMPFVADMQVAAAG